MSAVESDVARIIGDHTVYPRIGGQMCNGAECEWRSWEDGGTHAEHVAKLVVTSVTPPGEGRA